MNRRLSTYEYLRVLEIEYVVCELRHKIYSWEKDREYFKRVMRGKKEKIDDICLRNRVPSLFNDEKVRAECYNAVYGDGGYPNFHYRNDSQRMEFEEKDRKNYYVEGSDVSVLYDDGTSSVGVLVSVNIENEVCQVKLKGESEVRPFVIECVSRII